MPRKRLDENCNGSIDCPVEGHVKIWPIGYRNQKVQITHTPLTYGQILTLRERRVEERVYTRAQLDQAWEDGAWL